VISKALAYYTTLDWMEENKPSFDVIHIHPTLVIGWNELNTTVKEMNVGSNVVALKPLLGLQGNRKMVFGCVHIDDVATAHIKSLDPIVKGNQSFLLALPKLTGHWGDVIGISERLFPGIEDKFPLNGSTPSKTILYDSSKAERELGIVFKPLEEQVRSLVAHLIEIKDAE
jgi:nucleoside-diphosphate-sugar epimerase